MRKRIAVLYPSLNGGGAEAVCFWILEALKDDYHVTLVTLTPNDLSVFDRMYGTTLADSDIEIVTPVPSLLAPVSRFIFFRLGEFSPPRQHLLMRFFRRLQNRFDLCVSAYNEMDLGEPGIQYFHDPPRSRVGSQFFKRWSRYSEERMRANLSLVPSVWMGNVFRKAYGECFESRVVYPPARAAFRAMPWDERADDFLCIARLSNEKKLEDAVSILKEVRRRGYPVRLRILTAGGKWLYYQKIRRLVRRNSDWVFLMSGLSDDAYREALATHKYGINVAAQEGFGISIAELINAGCIPFVMGHGGQSEILDGCDFLHFSHPAEAVSKISSVLASAASQQALRGRLRARQGLFSTHRFQSEIRGIVDLLCVEKSTRCTTA